MEPEASSAADRVTSPSASEPDRLMIVVATG